MESLKKISILTVLFVLILLPAAYASFEVEPSGTVKTGQEVLFNASNYLTVNPNHVSSKYEWDFGDGTMPMKTQFGDAEAQGISQTHFYLYPGTYTATLFVTPTAGPVIQDSRTITVVGLPYRENPMNLLGPLARVSFENTIADSSGHGLTATYSGTPNYIIGPIGKGLDLNGSYVKLDNTAQFSGLNKFTISFFARKKSPSVEGVLFDAGNIKFEYTANGYGEKIKLTVVTSAVTTTITHTWIDLFGKMNDINWHLYVISYDGSILRLNIDQRIELSNLCTGTVNLAADLTIGANRSGTATFNGEIDEFTMSNKHFTYDDIAFGFELLHANYRARYAQYIYAKIPQSLLAIVQKLSVKLESDSGYNATIFEKTNPLAEEKLLLKNFELPPGNYTLTAKLLDSANNIITQVQEFFGKSYTGAPASGFDENNSLRLNGELFFPISPYGLNDYLFPMFASESTKIINCLFSKGFSLGGGYGGEKSIAAWRYYLDQARPYGLKAMGPLIKEGYYYPEHIYTGDLYPVFNYTEATKGDPLVIDWHWADEPELGDVGAPYMRSWTFASELRDDQHPTSINHAGKSWRGSDPHHRRDYAYLYNSRLFGGKRTWISDVLSFDWYPINWGNQANMYDIPDCFKVIKAETYNLQPIFAIMEPTSMYDSPHPTIPTAEQVVMEGWLAIVNGAKAIGWFHCHAPDPNNPIPAATMVAMHKQLNQITALTPVILGPEVSRTVSDNYDSLAEDGGRVDTMLREYNGNLYMLAVRCTELSEVASPALSVNFNISGIANATAEVYDEARTVSVSGGNLTDSFAPNAVHIYKIPVSGGATLPIGDVSGDGIVNAYDAALVAQAVVGLRELTPEQALRADVSGDGRVSAYDAALIAQYVVGLRERFPIEE